MVQSGEYAVTLGGKAEWREPVLAPTISIDIQGLWDNWQRSQRDDNIKLSKVTAYRLLIRQGSAPPPITFENIVFVDGLARIRTADGRHRITAAHLEGMATIQADDTDLARAIKDMFNL
jgi:hypothetical protein